MPRGARKKSSSGIYHIIIRGINRQSIFEDEQDKEKLLNTLIHYKEQCGYSIFGYCFMDNHLHLLLKIGRDPLAQVMRRISGSYVYWYNNKYERIGNLFQDRFKSEPVEDDSYFLTVLRYIHQNPVKAGIVKDALEYNWSSYGEYKDNKRDNRLTDTEFALKMFDDDNDLAFKAFIEYTNERNDDKCLEIVDKRKKLTDEELKKTIEKELGIKAIMIQNESKEKMKKLLRRILEIDGVSTRQLSRVTGISPNIIWRL